MDTDESQIIHVDNLDLCYQVRKIDPSKKWYHGIFKTKIEENWVLKKVNFSISKYGIYAILGKNGAGKTTLLKVLTGILTPTAGHVNVMGFLPHERQKKFLQQIGVVFGAKKMLWPELSLIENYELTTSIYQIDKTLSQKKQKELIELLDLVKLVHRPIKTLSLGETMKAELSHIFLFAPKLIFLDEPTIGLDLLSQRTIRKAIKEYVKDNKCHIILTSHNLRDITELADEIWFLENSQLTRFDCDIDSRAILEKHLERKLIGL